MGDEQNISMKYWWNDVDRRMRKPHIVLSETNSVLDGDRLPAKHYSLQNFVCHHYTYHVLLILRVGLEMCMM